MAKAVVPIDRFRQKFGDREAAGMASWLQGLVDQFLHDSKEGNKEGKSQKAEGKSEL